MRGKEGERLQKEGRRRQHHSKKEEEEEGQPLNITALDLTC